MGSLSGKVIDIFNRTHFSGTVFWENGKITEIRREKNTEDRFILPGFVDAHIHIESSMLTPYEFARIALTHGTVATVSDPHEIANVCGLEGIYFMLENAKDAKLKFHFGAPSCVPATGFETSGADLDWDSIETLLKDDRILYLAEMMNYPGVLNNDPGVMKKLGLARLYKKPVDGHAPGLRGDQAEKYIAAGITTDHECVSKEEALDKLKHGMKILIREGSAAKNFDALYTLISEKPKMVMLCSDDKHPDDLINGHIDEIVKRAIVKGQDMYDVLMAACVTPVLHYNLPVGLLRKGDPADFIVVRSIKSWNVLQTYINGEIAADSGKSLLAPKRAGPINKFHATPKSPSQFRIGPQTKKIRVIEALDGQLITRSAIAEATITGDNVVSDPSGDVLKIAVVNRYHDAEPAVAFIRNFGLKKGAIASSVAHDSHNIVAVGVSDEDICRAVNRIVEHNGGLCVVDGTDESLLPLPIAGLMSDKDCHETGNVYARLDRKAKALGCTLRAPFMTLSFMALLVIPSLKLSDKGLFDGEKFERANVFAEE